MTFKSDTRFGQMEQQRYLLREQEHVGPVLMALVVVALTYVIYNAMYTTDIPFIKGLPEIPGALPMVGHLNLLGDDHATTCEKWWRRNMPFPLPAVHDGVPHLNTTWYDFNYYTHLAMIYRPSPLCPVLDLKRIEILETATSMSIRQAYRMHQQRRLAYNWLNFLTLFTSTISLIYAITAQPDDLATVLRETRAIEDLDLALHLFETLGTKFLAATKIRNMIHEISKRYKGIRSGQTRGRNADM